MADHGRAAKLGDSIKQIIAKRLEKGLRDPRLGFVTITDVRMTGDLQHASVFFTVYGTEQEREDSAAALKAATGLLPHGGGQEHPRPPDPDARVHPRRDPGERGAGRRPARAGAGGGQHARGRSRPARSTPATRTRT